MFISYSKGSYKIYLFALLKVDLENWDGLGAAAAPVQLMLRAGAGRRLRTHIHVTEIGIPKSFFLERENSWEILQYLGKTKANQILKPKVVPEKKQYSRTRFQLILPVHYQNVTKI